MYKEELVSLQALFKLTNEPSLKALRSREKEGILVYKDVADNGRTRLYDNQLSCIREKAIKKLKKVNPRLSWNTFKRILERVDKGNHLNSGIILLLNKETPEEKIIQFVINVLADRFQQDGYDDFTNPAVKSKIAIDSLGAVSAFKSDH